jgi:hypothetical protein
MQFGFWKPRLIFQICFPTSLRNVVELFKYLFKYCMNIYETLKKLEERI